MITELIKIFTPSHTLISQREDDLHLNLKIKSGIIQLPDVSTLIDVLKFIEVGDTLNFSITVNEKVISLYTQTEETVKGFLTALNSVLEYFEDGNEVVIELTINKTKTEDQICIYSYETFSYTLINSTISQALSIFVRALGQGEKVFFKTLDSTHVIATNAFVFSQNVNDKNIAGLKNLHLLTETLKSTSFFSELVTYKIVPDAFKLTSPKQGTPLEALLEKLCLLFSIIYLFDISSLEDNNLTFRINGYKSINGVIDLKKSYTGLSNLYFSIYEWVYSGGNLSDKIGLARNIISLHFSTPGELQLKGNALHSIRSSFKVYEKQNIKQYIEIRNKVSDQVLDLSEKANKIIDSFASGFQKSALALITFYSSAIALKVLSTDGSDFINVFTLDATMLSIAFIVISFIYGCIARWEVTEQRKRFIKNYNFIKTRFSDLLDESDIKRLLNDDREFHDNKKYIDDKLKNYTRLWGSTLLILLAVTLFLFFKYK